MRERGLGSGAEEQRREFRPRPAAAAFPEAATATAWGSSQREAERLAVSQSEPSTPTEHPSRLQFSTSASERVPAAKGCKRMSAALPWAKPILDRDGSSAPFSERLFLLGSPRRRGAFPLSVCLHRGTADRRRSSDGAAATPAAVNRGRRTPPEFFKTTKGTSKNTPPKGATRTARKGRPTQARSRDRAVAVVCSSSVHTVAAMHGGRICGINQLQLDLYLTQKCQLYGKTQRSTPARQRTAKGAPQTPSRTRAARVEEGTALRRESLRL